MEQITKREERILVMEKLYTYDMMDDYIFLDQFDDYTDYVTELVNYVCAHLTAIDEVISASLVNYSLKRLSFVDRAIIRMSTAEMMRGLAATIAINEALEIVKEYSDQGDGANVRFVNKVLDNIKKNL